MPRVDASHALPAPLPALLDDGERALFHTTPIRRQGGLGVWLIMGAGLFYVPASIGALDEIAAKLAARGVTWSTGIAVAILLALAVFFLAFALVLVVWPLLSDRARRRTHVVITDRRVLEVRLTDDEGARPPRVKAWPLVGCDAASVARRRGRSATLVLHEHIRTRKSDGHPVYEWIALHGLPDAEVALEVLTDARARALAAIAHAAPDGPAAPARDDDHDV